VAQYGGDPDWVFVGGHSAGGHLVSLLTTDPAYLKAVGRSPKDIQGVIAVSGVYRLEDLDLKQLLGAPCCKCMDFRDQVNPITMVFGSDPALLTQASPMTHVHPGLPPFLLLSAGLDYPPLRKMTKEFAAALKDNGCEVETKVIPWRTHETLVFDIPHLTAEPKMVEAIVNFIGRCQSASAH
jgi:acetyl esterase/lipase